MAKKELSRRDFIKSAGAGALAAGVLAVCPAMAAGAEESDNSSIPAPDYPFTWHDEDVDSVQARAYQNFYDLGGCSRAVFESILGTLSDQYGYPYNQIPDQMFNDGHAGYTVGSLCGCLGGAAAVLGLFVPPEDVDTLLGELETWYVSTELPNYQPDTELIKTVAPTVDCNDSLGTWMAAAGVDDRSDPLRQSRCAGLCADVAQKAISLINVYYGLEEPVETEAATEAELADNEFIGSAEGMEGDVVVKVTVDDGKISAVEVIEQNETAGVGTLAVDQLPSQFVGMSSADEIDAVDVVSGASVTSNAIKEAVKQALAQAQ